MLWYNVVGLLDKTSNVLEDDDYDASISIKLFEGHLITAKFLALSMKMTIVMGYYSTTTLG